MLLHLGALLEPLGARGDDEGGVAARAELAIDRGDHDVDVRDPTVGRPGLLPVDDPLVLALVVLGGGPVAGDVGAGVRLGGAERADLDVVLVAEALRHPLDQLLGGARAEDPGDRERRPEDRHPDPGVAPEELLVHQGEGEPGRDRPRTARSTRTRRARSWPPPARRARGTPPSRPTHARRGGRSARRTHAPSRARPADPGRARARTWCRRPRSQAAPGSEPRRPPRSAPASQSVPSPSPQRSPWRVKSS